MPPSNQYRNINHYSIGPYNKRRHHHHYGKMTTFNQIINLGTHSKDENSIDVGRPVAGYDSRARNYGSYILRSSQDVRWCTEHDSIRRDGGWREKLRINCLVVTSWQIIILVIMEQI